MFVNFCPRSLSCALVGKGKEWKEFLDNLCQNKIIIPVFFRRVGAHITYKALSSSSPCFTCVWRTNFIHFTNYLIGLHRSIRTEILHPVAHQYLFYKFRKLLTETYLFLINSRSVNILGKIVFALIAISICSVRLIRLREQLFSPAINAS